MRSLNWNNIQATDDGGFAALPAGGYVVYIVDMVDKASKEYVDLIWDVAEGEHKGYYSDEWGKSHPYAHHVVLSYKDKALGMLKGRLEKIQKSNPGFDPFAAWDASRFDMFRNRVFGVNLQEEEYEKQDGSVGVRLNVCQVVDSQFVRDGKVKVRPKKLLDGKKSSNNDDVPAILDDGDEKFPF